MSFAYDRFQDDGMEPPDNENAINVNDVTIESRNHNGPTSPTSPQTDTSFMSTHSSPNGNVSPGRETTIEGFENRAMNNNDEGPVVKDGVAMYTANGHHVVVDPNRQSVQPEPCPVKEKNMKLFFIFSAISIFLFFPIGVFALYFAIKLRAEIHRGARTQSWTMAKRYKKRCQNCVIFSFISFFVALAIAIAVFEQVYYAHDDDYWSNRYHHPTAFG